MPDKRPDPADPPPPEDTYELDLPDDDEPAPALPPVRDVSSDVAAAVDAPEPTVAPTPGDPDRPKVSEDLYKHEGDPEFVDEEVKRMRRDEQRKAAAEQAALDAAAGRKRNIIFFVVALVVGIAVYVLVKAIF